MKISVYFQCIDARVDIYIRIVGILKLPAIDW